jgi:hypothetical protein
MSVLSVQLNYEFQEPDSRDYTIAYDDNLGLLSTSTGLILEASDLSYSFAVTDLSNINILSQGPIGTCVPNAYALTMSILATDVSFMSRLYLYTNARILSAIPINKDTGVTIRKAGNAIVKHGSSPEATWQYYPTNSFPRFPDFKTYHDASLISGFSYYFPLTTDPISLKQLLILNRGTPIIFGIRLYDSFFSNYVSTYGIVPVPNVAYEKPRGGHCMTIVGYDDMVNGGSFIAANSWGNTWGYKGFAYIPYSYIANPRLCGDFCIVKLNTVHPRLPFVTKPPVIPMFPSPPPPPFYPNVRPTPKPAAGPSKQSIIDAINAYNASLRNKKQNKNKLILKK